MQNPQAAGSIPAQIHILKNLYITWELGVNNNAMHSRAKNSLRQTFVEFMDPNYDFVQNMLGVKSIKEIVHEQNQNFTLEFAESGDTYYNCMM